MFYNGNEEQEDIVKYKLSDAFEIPDDSGEFEWTATVININKNHNEELQKKCESLYHYCVFVNRVKENLKNNLSLSEAVNEAVDFAISSKFLDGFFKEQRGAIMGDILTEFDQEAYDRHRRAEGAHDAKLENAKNFLKLGVAIETVAKGCSLPLEQVLALKEELSPATVTSNS